MLVFGKVCDFGCLEAVIHETRQRVRQEPVEDAVRHSHIRRLWKCFGLVDLTYPIGYIFPCPQSSELAVFGL